MNSIQKHAEKDELILLSLGMTATVLAYDLAKLGYWAIDMGHLDIEYEWYLKGDNNMDKPVSIVCSPVWLGFHKKILENMLSITSLYNVLYIS